MDCFNVTTKSRLYFSKVTDAFMLPQLIKLEKNLYVAAFRIMKLLPAKYILHEAIKRGDIKDNFTVVDTSSGTFALGIGLACAELGLPFRIFGDPAINQALHQQLEHLGGTIHISKNPSQPGAYQQLRLDALNSYLSENTLSFWMRQYDNLDNMESYKIVGELILDSIGANINVVGTVGSGGSSGGVIKTIREKNVSAKLIGVDTFNSVLFGQTNGPRELRGLGNTIMPKNLNHQLYDQIHWVSANDAYYHTLKLFTKKALFAGPTSGAAYQVANYLAEKNPKEVYIFIAPDEGYRYSESVYSNNWLKSQAFYSEKITCSPLEVFSPLDAQIPWAFMEWNRRSLEEIMSREAAYAS